MGKKRPTNENIHIGEIYESTSSDECGHSCSFYQVVGKRAKTLVELRAIRGEHFVDESCNLGLGQVKSRPLPGQFFEDDKVFTVRAATVSEYTGKKCLYKPEKSDECGAVYFEMREGEVGHLSGYDGIYALDQLKKEGKLPPWAKWHEK